MPYKIWTVGEEVLAADFNDYVQEQVVATFATAGARDAAITAPVVGQMCHLTGIGLQVWDGTAWRGPNVAVLSTAIPTPWTTSATTELTVATLSIPAQSRAYTLDACSNLTGDGAGNDYFVSRIKYNGTQVAIVQNRHTGAMPMNYGIPCITPQSIAAGAAATVTCHVQRISGTAGPLTNASGIVGVLSARLHFP